jgi:hypothetical protein
MDEEMRETQMHEEIMVEDLEREVYIRDRGTGGQQILTHMLKVVQSEDVGWSIFCVFLKEMYYIVACYWSIDITT